MAGKWTNTGTPGVYVQDGARTGRPRYKVAFRDPRGVVTSKTFPTKRLALAAQADLRTRRATRSLPDASHGRKTVSDLWKYLMKTSRARPSTRAWYESRWTNHVEPALGARRIDSIRRAELEAFLADVESRTSVATRRAVQQLVHKLFAVAVRTEWIVRNPADGVEMPAARPREARFLTEDEVRRIAGEVAPRYRAMVWTLALAGLRIGEATALRVKNVDGAIRVVQNSPEVRGRKLGGQTKTAGSERVVPIPPSLRAMLGEHVHTYGNRFDPESYVFTSERGSQVGQSNFRRRVFQPAAKRAGVTPTPTVHDLRHTAAALALRHGLTPYEVAKLLGHTDTKMIEKTYGHLYESAFQAKVDALDTILL
jgi:integrase